MTLFPIYLNKVIEYKLILILLNFMIDHTTDYKLSNISKVI